MLQRQYNILVVLLVVLVTAAGAFQSGDAAEEARRLSGAIDTHVA
jgi:hypothetical protein